MNRRQFLVSTTSATAIAIAGCTSANASSPQTPEEVTEAFVQAVLEGDYDRATSLMTDKGAAEMSESFVAEQHAIAERADGEIAGVETLQENENEAQVDVVLVHETAYGPRSSDLRAFLVEEDAVWLVNSFE